MLFKALALTTLLRAASAATEFSVEWGDWKNSGDGQRAKNPIQTWKDIGGKGDCKTQCEEYAKENYYETKFRCSYQDDKPHKCTITADANDDSDWADWVTYSNWRMVTGTPKPSNLLDDTVDSVILGVFNAAEGALNTAIVTVLEDQLDPMNGGFNKDFEVEWGDWKNKGDGQRGKNPVYTWKNIGGSNKGGCKDLCAQYAEDNNYGDSFICSYQDDSPHKCTITANGKTGSSNYEDYSNWRMVKGAPKQPGQYAYPLYEQSDKISYAGFKVEYDVKVTECYPKNGWDGSFILGPYTSISSDSFISPATFVGSVGVVGDVSMSKLICSASVSGTVLDPLGLTEIASGSGDGSVTASGSGAATAITESKECVTNGNQGIVLSPDSADIKLKKTEVNSCNIDLKITITGLTVDVGDILCAALYTNAFDLLDIIVGIGLDVAQDEIEDVLVDVNTGCIPVSLSNEVSTYDMFVFFDTRNDSVQFDFDLYISQIAHWQQPRQTERTYNY